MAQQKESRAQVRVLVLRLSSLGDIVHTSGAANFLHQQGVQLTYVVKPAFSDLLEQALPYVEVYTYDKSVAGEARARAKFLDWCKEQKFDAILDLHDSLRTQLWRSQLRSLAPVFVAKKPRWREFLVIFLRLKWAGLGKGGRAKLYLNTAQKLYQSFNLPIKGNGPWPPTKLEVPKSVNLALRIPQRPFLVFVPGSQWRQKQWSVKRFAILAKKLARDYPILVLGSRSENFCTYIAKAAQKINPASCDLHGRTTLGDAVYILARAHTVIGNDTGLVHIAEALGKPVISIEGPTSKELGFSVYGKQSKIVAKDLWCRPCGKSGRVCWRFNTRKCLRSISVDNVMDQFNAKEV